ncbi:aspartyl-phosphate phosphatase Spo0E family protein [Bacillus sp. CGMCC 1.16541]|uniref:aspartyl-phosphate phosphatase Spo0E family protein n=1 Tax=Bacillus sp. CGMCC 1.16541 TaxID=2185143 RepID=UPI0019518EBD|nr:aspartyl-phosphate phosphatase Spo0E family protein [Bacillus sp. CGMCC 1.16541]
MTANSTQYTMSLIEEKRQEMIKLALSNGLTHQETVQISQQLDSLLNLMHLDEQPLKTQYA